jgi:ribosomal protein L29
MAAAATAQSLRSLRSLDEEAARCEAAQSAKEELFNLRFQGATGQTAKSGGRRCVPVARRRSPASTR